MKLLFLLVLLLAACTTEPYRQYNHEDLQDKECQTAYGAKYGYCDVPLKEISK